MTLPNEPQDSQHSTPSFWDRLLKGDEKNPPLAQNTAVIIGSLICLFPVGLFFMWRFANWDKRLKWGLTVGIPVMMLIGALLPDSQNSSPNGSAGTSRRNNKSIEGKWWHGTTRNRGQIMIVDDSTMRIVTTDADFTPIQGAEERVYEYQIIPNTDPTQINRHRISPPLANLERDKTLHGIFMIKDNVLFICEELDGKESQRPKKFAETRDEKGIIFTSLSSWHGGSPP